MKGLFFIAILLLTANSTHAAEYARQSKIQMLTVHNDTLRNNNQPYCLFRERDGLYSLSTFSLQHLVYIQKVSKSGADYYRVLFSPLNQVYFTPYSPNAIDMLLQDCINFAIIEDGYFSAYGANSMIKSRLADGSFITEENLPATVEKPTVYNWDISWKSTSNKDSTIILANGVPFGYYIYSNRRDYGIDRYRIAYEIKADYRYFIYKLDNTPLAEVRVADGWKTRVTILAADGEKLVIEEVPNNKDFMTLAAKLILLKDVTTKK